MKNLKKISRKDLKKISGGYSTVDCSNLGEAVGTFACLGNQPGFISCISFYSDDAIGCKEGEVCKNGTCVTR
ncbi:bacteriocin-like protein [Chryseobacterium sp. GP-SGM7]|uniref:bacteriocin-like protein n=1 Tax=Chryseobacterium sp. GP-SGM7 TaxID=3411323 RepID=UPI003B93F5FA